jgi:hypothetical protein
VGRRGLPGPGYAGREAPLSRVQHRPLAEVLIVLGFIAFAVYQSTLPAARRTVIDPRAALWVLPWLVGLLILSWLGRYNGSPPTVFGVTLLATNHLPNWWTSPPSPPSAS